MKRKSVAPPSRGDARRRAEEERAPFQLDDPIERAEWNHSSFVCLLVFFFAVVNYYCAFSVNPSGRRVNAIGPAATSGVRRLLLVPRHSAQISIASRSDASTRTR